MSLVRSFDVFLSYSHADAAGAQQVDAWLRAQEVRAFYDRRELRGGLQWLPALQEAIGSSGAAAILIGAHGIGNTQQYWLRRRWSDVRDQRHAGPQGRGHIDLHNYGFLSNYSMDPAVVKAWFMGTSDRRRSARAGII